MTQEVDLWMKKQNSVSPKALIARTLDANIWLSREFKMRLRSPTYLE